LKTSSFNFHIQKGVSVLSKVRAQLVFVSSRFVVDCCLAIIWSGETDPIPNGIKKRHLNYTINSDQHITKISQKLKSLRNKSITASPQYRPKAILSPEKSPFISTKR